MHITWEFGPMDHELEQAVNRRLMDGWYVASHHLDFAPVGSLTGAPPFAVFIFADEPPGDDIWVDPDVVGKRYNFSAAD